MNNQPITHIVSQQHNFPPPKAELIEKKRTVYLCYRQ